VGITLKCPVSGCSFQLNADTKEQLISQALDHAKTVHNMSSIPPDMMAKITAAAATAGFKMPF